jgi:hypothetical protein
MSWRGHLGNLAKDWVRAKLLGKMEFSRAQIGIAMAAASLLLLIFFGYLIWLDRQGPVLGKSEERDPLSQVPDSISLNPLRDHTSERVAYAYLNGIRDGHCRETLASWVKDYRKKYAQFICDSEASHPLLSWKLVDWEDDPPLRLLRFRGKRRESPSGTGTYKELFSLTLENKDGTWEVTKYEAMY